MKYERKSPYADGFNDIYTTAGVDVDDYWGPASFFCWVVMAGWRWQQQHG